MCEYDKKFVCSKTGNAKPVYTGPPMQNNLQLAKTSMDKDEKTRKEGKWKCLDQAKMKGDTDVRNRQIVIALWPVL